MLARSIDLGFLGARPFRCEYPARGGWIILDFLGFSRPNRDLSMGYTASTAKNFSRALLPDTRGAGIGNSNLRMLNNTSLHVRNLT